MKADGLNEPIVSDGTVVTYYYKNKAAPEEKPALAIDKASISLESSITMNFKVPKSSLSSYDDFYMTFKCNGKKKRLHNISRTGITTYSHTRA